MHTVVNCRGSFLIYEKVWLAVGGHVDEQVIAIRAASSASEHQSLFPLVCGTRRASRFKRVDLNEL